MANPLTLVSAATAANGAPSLTTAPTAAQTLDYLSDQVTILVHSTAGSGTMTVTVAIWAYYPEAGRWYRLGLLNSGNAIEETSANAINYAEAVVGLRGATGLYAEITAIAGTSTAVTVAARAVPASVQST
jgi:hypothetical protein